MTSPDGERPAAGLLLDIQACQSREHGERGIARYVAEQARALLRVPGLVRGLLINPVMPFPGHLHPELSTSPLLRWNTATEVRSLVGAASEQPLAYWLMSPFELGPPVRTVLPGHILDNGLPLIATLYDLVPLLEPARYLANLDLRRRYRTRLEVVRQADLVLCDSETARRDGIGLLGLDPARTVVVGGGASAFFTPPPPGDDPGARLAHLAATIAGLDPSRHIVLSVSAPDARKNTERLIGAYGRLDPGLRATHRLVVACRLDPPTEARWRGVAGAAGLRPDEVTLTGQVDDATLLDLYRAARLFVLPSLHEGFGLPVAEAIACGCPAITSDTSASPEILDDPMATFDATDEPAIAAAIHRALSDRHHLGRLRDLARRRAGMWRWEEVATRVVGALDVLGAPTHLAALPQRIALVGPLGEGPVAAVAAALGERCSLATYDTTAGRPAPGALPAASLLRDGGAAEVDAVVLAVDGRAGDAIQVELARRHPAVVWLRALNLVAAVEAEAARPEWPPRRRARHWVPPPPAGRPGGIAVGTALREQYGPRVPSTVLAEVAESGVIDPRSARRYGLLLTEPLTVAARAVVVEGESAAHRLRLDAGPDGLRAPLHVVSDGAGAVELALALLAAVTRLGAPHLPETSGAEPLGSVAG